MTDAEVQLKLNQLVKIANDLNAEAQRRFGRDAKLFYESGGNFLIMSADVDPDLGTVTERNEFIEFQSNGCHMGCGSF